MPQITNLDLKKQLDELSKAFQERFEKVEKRVDMIEKRVLPTIERVDSFFAVLRKFMTFLKWLAGVITVALAGQAVVWLFQHLAAGH